MYDDYLKKDLQYHLIIDYDKFQKLRTQEKYEYLIQKNILVKAHKWRPSFICVYDSVPILYKEPEFEFLDFCYHDKNYYYTINIDVKNEYYDYLYVRIEDELILADSYHIISSIKAKIKYLLKKEKKKALKKYYNYYSKKFSHYDFDIDYLNSSLEQEGSWKDFIQYIFAPELFKYLSGYQIEPEMVSVIEMWVEVNESTNVMLYCKKELEQLNKESLTKKQTVNSPTNFPLVFKDLNSENIFLKFLKEYNAIDNSNTPVKRRFQPLCKAFFTVIMHKDNSSQYIIKRGTLEKDYIQMLNQLFGTTLKRLSNGQKHEDFVQEFLNSKTK